MIDWQIFTQISYRHGLFQDRIPTKSGTSPEDIVWSPYIAQVLDTSTDSWDKFRAASYESVFSRLDSLLSNALAITKGEVTGILTLYCLCTYCYRLFPSLGVLHVRLIGQDNLLDLLSLFEAVCFNGYRVNPHDSTRAIRAIIPAHSPTLLFEGASKYKPTIKQLCLEGQNRSLRTHLTFNGSFCHSQTYCPKVIVSGDSLRGRIRSYAIELTLPLFCRSFAIDFDGITDLRLQAMSFSLEKEAAINDRVERRPRDVSTNQPAFPLSVMAEGLKQFNMIGNAEFLAVEEGLARLTDMSNRGFRVSVTEEILKSLPQFLHDFHLESKDEAEIPTSIAVHYLKKKTTVDPLTREEISARRQVTPRRISCFL